MAVESAEHAQGGEQRLKSYEDPSTTRAGKAGLAERLHASAVIFVSMEVEDARGVHGRKVLEGPRHYNMAIVSDTSNMPQKKKG